MPSISSAWFINPSVFSGTTNPARAYTIKEKRCLLKVVIPGQLIVEDVHRTGGHSIVNAVLNSPKPRHWGGNLERLFRTCNLHHVFGKECLSEGALVTITAGVELVNQRPLITVLFIYPPIFPHSSNQQSGRSNAETFASATSVSSVIRMHQEDIGHWPE